MTKLWLAVRLVVALSIMGGLAVPAEAEDKTDDWVDRHFFGNTFSLSPLLPLPPSSQLLTQMPLVQITNVRLEETAAGLQMILETTDGELSTPKTTVSGNALVVEIDNVVLLGEDFAQFEPSEGIAFVQVSALSDDQVQVVITGENALPIADIGTDPTGLTLTVMPGIAQVAETDEPLRIVVTGEESRDYNPSSASTATRTDTPLRDIPQSIQVVPQQVLEDRNVQSVNQAIETVSGINIGASGVSTIFRGFSTEGTSQLRNGYRTGNSFTNVPDEPTVALERVEVLKGPGSVLFGALEPGGVINLITKKPLSEPYSNLGLEVGNRGFYQPNVDLSGPLTDDDTVLYRLIAAHNTFDGYFNGGGRDNTLISPSISLNLGEQTDLDLFYEFSRFAGDLEGGLSVVALSNGSITPRGVNVWGNSELTFEERKSHRYGLALEHDFNENLQIRSSFTANNFSVPEQRFAVPIEVIDERFVDFFYNERIQTNDIYFGQIDLLGKFNTGSIEHQLLLGFDYENDSLTFESFEPTQPIPPLDLLNPIYDVGRPTDFVPGESLERQTETYGIYFQDQIAFSENWKLLIGGRYDWVSNELEIFGDSTDQPMVNDSAFSPRIGLVYQPNDTVSLYGSYSRSFLQTTSVNPDQIFEPTRGTQYEVGIKTDFLDKRLSATLTAYHLTKTNVTTSDPNNPLFSIQTGEQRSQGIELDVAGEIMPGWNVIFSYAHTDAEVTEDNDIPVGNQLNSVPFNQSSLWTTYEIQQGSLEGLGFGLGLFYIGERQGDLANSFELDDYLRTDAALYYRKENFNAAINIRNLFDIDYVRFSDFFVQRGEPFTITGSVSWEF